MIFNVKSLRNGHLLILFKELFSIIKLTNSTMFVNYLIPLTFHTTSLVITDPHPINMRHYTKKQKLANQRNAKKSTGPKTPEGKAKSSQNAIKHGLYAKSVIIRSPNYNEDRNEYDQLAQSLFEELKPATHFQETLVIKIINCLWRSQRLIIAETAKISDQINTAVKWHDPKYGDNKLNNEIGIKQIPNENFSKNLMRYEMRLDKQLSRTYELLKQLQKTSKPKSKSKSEETNPFNNPRAVRQGGCDPAILGKNTRSVSPRPAKSNTPYAPEINTRSVPIPDIIPDHDKKPEDVTDAQIVRDLIKLSKLCDMEILTPTPLEKLNTISKNK